MSGEQLNRDELRRMSPAAIAQAFREGRCRNLLKAQPPADTAIERLRERLRALPSPEVAALGPADLDQLLEAEQAKINAEQSELNAE
jgi:hypothetical protein